MTEAERIERFETAYNRIDRKMGELIGDERASRHRTFASKVRGCANRHRRMVKFVDFLLEIGDLRNAMVHNRTGDDLYLAVPSERTVEELELIEQQMFAPKKVQERFVRDVLILRPQHTLAEAFELIRDDGYSRYPVYDDGQFIGLATANGFTRWLASRFTGGTIEIDPHQVTIDEVLEHDHRRDLVEFVAAKALVDDVAQLFADRKPLEAVVVTEHGRRDELPIGLIAPNDVAGLD